MTAAARPAQDLIDRKALLDAVKLLPIGVLHGEWGQENWRGLNAADVLALIDAAPPARRAECRVGGLDAHPGESHTFRTTCERCGEPGQLFVAILGPDETATIAPRAAALQGEGT